jgi:hypothetical protein
MPVFIICLLVTKSHKKHYDVLLCPLPHYRALHDKVPHVNAKEERIPFFIMAVVLVITVKPANNVPAAVRARTRARIRLHFITYPLISLYLLLTPPYLIFGTGSGAWTRPASQLL